VADAPLGGMAAQDPVNTPYHRGKRAPILSPMKTRGSLPFFAAAMGSVALLLLCSCTKSDDSVTTVQATRPDGSNVTVAVSDTNVSVDATDAWDRIKDFAYDRRADFSAGIDRMSKDMDDKTAAFRTRAAGVSDAVASDRDSAMKEFDSARADLKARRTDLDNATADTWSDAKAKAGESWKSTKAAYSKVAKANASS
jgi:hypothetical protein